MCLQSTRIKHEDGVIIQALTPIQPDIMKSWSLVYYPPHMRLKKHSHDTAQFSVLLSGQSRETIRGHTFDSRPMLMEFKPAGFEHSNEFGPDGALLLSININSDNVDFNDVYPSQDWLLRHSIEIQESWTQLTKNILSDDIVDPGELETITIDLLNILAQQNDEYLEATPPTWLQRARAAIVETDDEIQSIAEAVDVHRVHLSRAFRRYFGHTISACRRELRLARAVRLLAHSGASVSMASYEAGFSDQSHLTRMMRQEVGVTPAHLRKFFRM